VTSLDLREPARRVARQELVELWADPALVSAAIGTWRGRMINEHGSARVFEGLAAQMQQAGYDREKITTVASFAHEERHHGVLCGAVVEALGGSAAAEALVQGDLPLHEDAADEREAVLRNAMSIGCLSETVAVALIGAERFEMPEGVLRQLLTRIWADEVGHARFAWKLLGAEVPRLSAKGRQGLSEYLAVALAHLEQHELAHLPLAAPARPGGETLGLCSGAEARALFYDTVRSVILPGLAALGLDAQGAWASRGATLQ
jgi:hypothetical protein